MDVRAQLNLTNILLFLILLILFIALFWGWDLKT